jgi:hypothetical protein
MTKHRKPATVDEILNGPKPKLKAVQLNDHKTGHYYVMLPEHVADELRKKQRRQGYGSNLDFDK